MVSTSAPSIKDKERFTRAKTIGRKTIWKKAQGKNFENANQKFAVKKRVRNIDIANVKGTIKQGI